MLGRNQFLNISKMIFDTLVSHPNLLKKLWGHLGKDRLNLNKITIPPTEVDLITILSNLLLFFINIFCWEEYYNTGDYSCYFIAISMYIPWCCGYLLPLEKATPYLILRNFLLASFLNSVITFSFPLLPIILVSMGGGFLQRNVGRLD